MVRSGKLAGITLPAGLVIGGLTASTASAASTSSCGGSGSVSTLAGTLPDQAALGPDYNIVLMARHSASAAPIGVHAGPWTNGQISSAMQRQSAVAASSPSSANRPRLIRCRIT